MCVIQRGLVSQTEGDNMTSQAGHNGGGSQLYPNQGFVKIKATGKNVLSHLWAFFQILSSICFCWELLFLCSMAFMLIPAHGEEQTGMCQLLDPASIWDISLVVNPEILGLCPSLSTLQFPMPGIPHGHINIENDSPDPLGPPHPSRANVKVVAVMI